MKGNIAEEITNRVLEDLGKGVTPWEKPWKQGRGLPLPVNASTGKHYRGINVFVLNAASRIMPRGSGFPVGLGLEATQSFGIIRAPQERRATCRQGDNVPAYSCLLSCSTGLSL